MAENIIHPSCFEADIQCPKCAHFDKGVYCSNCGSTLTYHRLSITKLLVNLFNGVLSFEEVYISTLKSLIKRPINFIKAYINGDREGYSTPIKSLLINLTVCFFITNYFDLEPYQDILVSESEKISIKSFMIMANYISYS